VLHRVKRGFKGMQRYEDVLSYYMKVLNEEKPMISPSVEFLLARPENFLLYALTALGVGRKILPAIKETDFYAWCAGLPKQYGLYGADGNLRNVDGVTFLAYQVAYLCKSSIHEGKELGLLGSANSANLDAVIDYFKTSVPYHSGHELYEEYLGFYGPDILSYISYTDFIPRLLWSRNYCLAGLHQDIRKIQPVQEQAVFNKTLDCTNDTAITNQIEGIQKAINELNIPGLLDHLNFLSQSIQA
jgi:hypothetical protein